MSMKITGRITILLVGLILPLVAGKSKALNYVIKHTVCQLFSICIGVLDHIFCSERDWFFVGQVLAHPCIQWLSSLNLSRVMCSPRSAPLEVSIPCLSLYRNPRFPSVKSLTNTFTDDSSIEKNLNNGRSNLQ